MARRVNAVLCLVFVAACGGDPARPARAPASPPAAPPVPPASPGAPPPADGTYFFRTATTVVAECNGGAQRAARIEAHSALDLRGEQATFYVSVEGLEQASEGCPRSGERRTDFRARFAGTSKLDGATRRLDFRSLDLSERPSPDGPYRDAVSRPAQLTLSCTTRTVQAYPADDEDMVGVNENDPVEPREAIACRPQQAPLEDVLFSRWLVDGALLFAREPGLDWRSSLLPPAVSSQGLRIGSDSMIEKELRRRAVW